jgi:hypothetical protein
MKIDKRLNFVLPVTRVDGTEIYIHSTPIDSNCFRTYYRVLAKAFSVVMWELGPMSGPRVADKVLEDVATEMGQWETEPGGAAGVKQGLIADIQRRTSVVAPSDRGWEPIPYHEAVQRQILEPDDVAEVGSALVFFTAGSHMFRERERSMMLSALKHWSARIESSNATEFANFLSTSTAVASTGERPPTSSPTPSNG